MPPILGSEGFLIRPFRSQYWRNRTGSQKVHSNLPVSILAHWTLSSLSHSRIYLVLNPSPVALNISFQSTSLMEATGTKSLPRLLMKEVSGVSPLLSATQKATDFSSSRKSSPVQLDLSNPSLLWVSAYSEFSPHFCDLFPINFQGFPTF